MATTTKRPRKTAEKPTPAKEEKKERAPKAEPNFSSQDVMAKAKTFVSAVQDPLGVFKKDVAEMLAECEKDPKTYRDIVTTVKFVERRAARMTLSLDELQQGLKERAPRKPKEESEPKKPRAKAAEPDEADEEEEPEDQVEDDDEDELDLDDDE